MGDLSTMLSDAGLSLGTLTFNVVLRGLLILLIGIICIRILLSMFDRAGAKNEKFGSVAVHLRPIIKFVLGLVLILVVLGSLGVQVTSFIALLSVAGLAVSLALQNTLANFAGGIMVIANKPYTVGDYVSIGGNEGFVESVSLGFTNLKTIDNKVIHIPNSAVAASTVTNFNALGRRRVDLTFTASYDDKTEDVYAALRDLIASFPQVITTPEPEIHVSEYGASSITYLTRAWVNAADYWDVYFGMLERVREFYAKHGVEMSYQHVNVHMIEK